MAINKNEAGLASKIRRAIPGAMTVTEAAAVLGRSPDTLVRWRKTGVYVPKQTFRAGQLVIPVYTGADIAAMRRLQPSRPRQQDDRPADWAPAAVGNTGFTARLPSTYRTPAHMARLVRIKGLLAQGKPQAAQEYLERLVNLTPSDRRFVQKEIDAAS